ncbi:3-dehydroquinate synthase [Candidiatus Paracoxiella cheracis]|uniref:3-dehydroquinate synthase n=1 Tax=Candidiatus Paracoxiella cheracis TaxID=3405120 RepID=UPI003BF4AE19
MKTKKVIVKLKERSYPIYIGQGLLSDPELFREHVPSTQVMIVTNETVAALYLSSIKKIFSDRQCDSVILPDGEAYKTIEQWHHILDTLAKNHYHRDATLIALGGGVVGDTAGFAAACYQRGIPFIQVPTTLLSQVDSSIGGKTSVNHPSGKNLIGAFHQPKAVFIDVTTLNTLPEREFNAGIAEIIKAALIKDAKFFKLLESNMPRLLRKDPDALIPIIQRACEIKRDIVMADEKETAGVRELLNLGHTFGHAIEKSLGYGEWLHGEAVSAGLVLAATLSQHKGWIKAEDVDRLIQLLHSIPLPTQLPNQVKYDTLLPAMMMDKKVLANRLRLVLLKNIGHAIVTDEVTEEEIKGCIHSRNASNN